MFGVFGKIRGAKILGRDSTYSRGRISFDKKEAGQQAMNTMNGKEIHRGYRLYVRQVLGQNKNKEQNQERLKESTLLVSMLPCDISEEQIRKILEKVGQIESFSFLHNDLSRARVQYYSSEAAVNAIKKLHQTNPFG